LLSPVQSTFILPVTLSLRLDTINAYLEFCRKFVQRRRGKRHGA
jgi:hypothetical protein